MSSHMITGRLLATEHEQAALDETIMAFFRARAYAIQAGRRMGTTGNALIHQKVYHHIRSQYGLSANLAVRAIASAAKQLKTTPEGDDLSLPSRDHTLPSSDRNVPGGDLNMPGGDRSVPYDSRILSLSKDATEVSLSTTRGRLKGIPILLPGTDRQKAIKGNIRSALLSQRAEGYFLTCHLKGEAL